MDERENFKKLDNIVPKMTGIFYGYSNRPESKLAGPYRVERVGQITGAHFADLKPTTGNDHADDRRVFLDTDDDYGYPCFYVRQT